VRIIRNEYRAILARTETHFFLLMGHPPHPELPSVLQLTKRGHLDRASWC
jgi:hypothetical protein